MQALMRHSSSARTTAKVVASFALLAMAGGLACASPRATGAAALGGRGLDACARIPEAALESSPLEAPYAIERVAAVYRYLWTGRGAHRVPVARSATMTGVLVTVHTPSWTTREELEVRLQCHVAWMRSREDGSPTKRSCPLAVPGASAGVHMGFGQRFIIAIRSDKESAAEEVWRRASALAGTSEGASEDGEQLE